MTAVLADIHGNAWALEAVLEDARRRGAADFIDLGDALYGPLAPRRTYDLLRRVNLVAQVKGNQDRFIVDGAPSPTLDWVRADLGPEPVAWLDSLPSVRVHRGWLLCHGAPLSDTAYLLEDILSGSPQVRPEAQIAALLNGAAQPWILCGHSHVARLVALSSTGQTILNPGSVGLQAYGDDAPAPHFMQSFSPHACYAIEDAGAVSFHRVPYDWAAAAARARELGREDWARAVASGRMD